MQKMTEVGPTVATSERLILRSWTATDAEPLFEMYSHDEVARLYGSRPADLSEVQELLDDFNQREAGLGVTTWAVELRSSGCLVGWCGYGRTNAAWLSPNVVEIGWLLDFARWGQGLATEAATAALKLGEGRLSPSRIISKCHVENVRSERVMQRIGLRRAGLVAGDDHTTVVYRHGYKRSR